MKLALGTVQFGLPYGLSNTNIQPLEADVINILQYAATTDIDLLDTAHLYGESEAVIGRSLPLGHNFRIVTKTPKFAGVDRLSVANRLNSAFHESCYHLRSTKLHALLVHDVNDLLGPNGDTIWRAMQDLKERNSITYIGASVYDAIQMDRLINTYPIDLIQLPLSLLDQRLVQSGHLDLLVRRGIIIHARSAFLQGALLMRPEELPQHLHGLGSCVKEVLTRSAKLGISPLQAALGFLAALNQVNAVVCGVNSLEHLKQIVLAMKSLSLTLGVDDVLACACKDERLLDPSQWKVK
jgi:aryl-alcohol dehydrogenase-like predicted oxidoreductase